MSYSITTNFSFVKYSCQILLSNTPVKYSLTKGLFFIRIKSNMLSRLIGQVRAASDDIIISKGAFGFKPPELTDVITFFVRFLFIIAGLAALLYLLLGAISWITSGGNKESVDNARNKIMNAIIGLILVFVVMAVVVLLENVLFPGDDCGLGVSKPICVPRLIKPST